MYVTHGTTARPVLRPWDLVVRRLSALADLAESDLRQIRAAAGACETWRAGRELQGDRRAARRARFVVSGWACRRRILPDGRRQIFSFVVPGDPVDFKVSGLTPSDVTTVALTHIETFDAEGLRQSAEDAIDHPGLARAFATLADQEDRLLLDQIARLGRMTAVERLAHLLLELRERLMGVGLADERRMPLPLTQEILADALGLSIVHVNRTLQQLRQDGLIELRAGTAVLPAAERLADLCGYRLAGPPRIPTLGAPGLDAPGAAPA